MLLRNLSIHVFWITNNSPTVGVPNCLLCLQSSTPPFMYSIFNPPLTHFILLTVTPFPPLLRRIGHVICVFKFPFLYLKTITVSSFLSGFHLPSIRWKNIKYLSKFNSVPCALYPIWSPILYSFSHLFIHSVSHLVSQHILTGYTCSIVVWSQRWVLIPVLSFSSYTAQASFLISLEFSLFSCKIINTFFMY